MTITIAISRIISTTGIIITAGLTPDSGNNNKIFHNKNR